MQVQNLQSTSSAIAIIVPAKCSDSVTLSQAHVVCIVYDVTQHASLDRVSPHILTTSVTMTTCIQT